ncbi:tectonic-3 isoform X1 [Amia ocellicauda]|uniref:tectonic-3 isoform X1 n=1 Tax=Amia ocellicauda TaxID=2972642 RepID=UPI003463DFEE
MAECRRAPVVRCCWGLSVWCVGALLLALAASQAVMPRSVQLSEQTTASATDPISAATDAVVTSPLATDPVTAGPAATDVGATHTATTGPADPVSTATDTTHTGTTGPTDSVTTATDSTVPRAGETNPTSSTAASVCSCDVTPGLCDIGCCCDLTDCGLTDPRSVFTTCAEEVRSAQCVESWLMFRGNVPSGVEWRTDGLFCVETDNSQLNYQSPPSLSLKSGDPSFSLQGSPKMATVPRAFYRADDVLLTYYTSTSIVGVLRQPSPGAASTTCLDRNPAVFLRSVSVPCSRRVTPQSCQTDPSLSAASYHADLSLLTIPVPENASQPGNTIPVVPVSEWSAPALQGNNCISVVSKVSYVVWYSGSGRLLNVTLNVTLSDFTTPGDLLQQHTVTYQKSGSPAPAATSTGAGLVPGAPVIGIFNGMIQPLTVLGVSGGGLCSRDVRTPVLFRENYISGCSFSSSSLNCSALRVEAYRILQGNAAPHLLAMTRGAQPDREADWTRVITENCTIPPLEQTCETGCVLPLSLSIQILWAQRGQLSLPQGQLLGTKLSFSCQTVKCLQSRPVSLMTEVSFADTTVYPEPPRGQPQPHWKLPLDFFQRWGGW